MEKDDYVPKEEAGLWAEITVGVKRSAIEFLLAAAVALTITKLNNTVISDSSGLWSKEENHYPEEFLDILALNSKFQRYIEQAKEYLKE